MKSKSTIARHGLYVTEKHDREYYHVSATVVTIGPTIDEYRWLDQYPENKLPGQDCIRNAPDNRHDLAGLYLYNFRVYSQGDRDSRSSRGLYGFEYEYADIHTLDLRKAEASAKTLRTIEKRMAKLYERFGNAPTFGQYVARVAECIGASGIVAQQGPSRGWSYSDSEQRIMTLADGVYYIDRLVYAWQHPEKEKETA